MSTLIPVGARPLPLRETIAWSALGLSIAAVPALWMWGFTVDDALISVRYARHVASGVGWRFNVHGPSTDGVTPLPWPLVLAAFARADALTVLFRAKALGLCAWIATGAALGRSSCLCLAPRWARLAPLAAIALCMPLAAYAVSGMETAAATSLATFAVLARSPRVSAFLGGLAATFRPEMVAWAFVLGAALAAVPSHPVAGGSRSFGPAEERPHSGLSLDPRIVASLRCGVLALLPFAACASVRVWAWGRPAPLAVLAKPGDPSYGVIYAAAAYFVTVVPLLVTAPWAIRRSPRAAAIVLASAAHACCVIAVGGDWMPYARLFVPIVPSLAVAAVLLSERAHPAGIVLRSLSALVLGATLIAHGGTGGRRVGADREALIVAARPLLAGAHRVAALDVGWVGAATEADIVDLAGVTDPQIASLEGGHTSKHVSATMLLERDPDRVLLYAPAGLPGGRLDAWRDATFRGAVEARLAGDDLLARHFDASAWLALGKSGAGYVVLTRRDAAADSGATP